MTVKNPIYCPNCGGENDPDAIYCINCSKAMREKVSIVDSNGNIDKSSQHPTSSSVNTSNSAERSATANALRPQQPISESIEPLPTQIFLSRDEMHKILQKLQNLATKMEDYFPANLPEKQKKLDIWKQQIDRAQSCLNILEHPLLQEPALYQALDQHHALTEAISALDFTREYTVKLIGPAGAGKSTLLNALLGRDILPTGFGTAVTGVRTRIYLCSKQEPEELRIRFLTRKAFDKLLSETEAKKNEELDQKVKQQQIAAKDGQAQQPEEDGPYTKEWKRLLYLKDHGPNKNIGQTYIEKYLDWVEPLVIPFAEWRTEGYKFIMEPTDDKDPYLVRLVDTSQFNLHVNQSALLPEGSIMVDLPGSSAGKVSHDDILREELRHLNAVILVANGPRYDNEGARKIFEQVHDVIWNNNRSSEVAARMVFIAATRWDEIKKDDDLKSAQAGMDALVKKLPASYQKYHRHGLANSYAFYPISAFDARMAMLGLEEATLDAHQQEESRTYKGHITAVYDKLREIDPGLPTIFTAKEFKDFPHQTMLAWSGLPELISDLQRFLAEQRYEVQLQHAMEQLNQAFQRIEELCWDYLHQQEFSGRDIQRLKKENQRRESRLKDRRIEYIQSLANEMRTSWKNTMSNYDRVRIRGRNQNSFYLALKEAYRGAVEHIHRRIDDGEFDPFVDVASHMNNENVHFSWTISPREEFTDIYGKNLRSALRSRLWGIMEQRIGSPAQVLTDMFLTSIEKQGPGTNGTLDIRHIAFEEESDELDEISSIFEKLLEDIRSTARDVCRYVTMGELLDENKHELAKDHPLMTDLYKLGDIAVTQAADQLRASEDVKTSEDILEIARSIMKKMVIALSDGLVESTYQRIAFIYRCELDKLEYYTVYDILHPDTSFTSKPGRFSDMVNRLYLHMLSLLDTSPTLSFKIDTTGQEEINFSAWAEFIEQMRKQKKGA